MKAFLLAVLNPPHYPEETKDMVKNYSISIGLYKTFIYILFECYKKSVNEAAFGILISDTIILSVYSQGILLLLEVRSLSKAIWLMSL